MLASNAADRTSQRWHGASRAGTEQKFAVRCHGVVEPALYTVEGRQAGDLRQKCGSALIRKAKLPCAIVWKAVLFWQGWLIGALSASATREVVHASHLGRR